MLLRKINHYSILELLGKGSFGKVYLVESDDRQHYALKSIEDIEEILDAVKKEAHMYASLDHQNIVKLHEFFPY